MPKIYLPPPWYLSHVPYAPFLKNSILNIYYKIKIITMFYQLKNTLVAAMLLPLAIGCKRENPNQMGTSPITVAPETHKVQQWLNGNPKTLTALRANQQAVRKAGNSLPNFTLRWPLAGFDAATRTHWVPATFANTKVAGGKPNTYLIATENAQGQITGGQYIMVLPNAKKMGKGQADFEPVALLGTEKPRDFSGAILYYDVQGQLTGSKVYEAGQVQLKTTANLAARDLGQGSPSPNKVIRECGEALGIPVCIDWYWQTYVNGVLVDEDYMFTTCCSGTSGGGSGVNNNGECQAQLDAMVAAGSVVSNAPIEETTVSITNTEWIKNYSWKIFSAANTWGLLSYDKGTLEKVYYPSSNKTFWEYKAFEHTKIGEAGFTAGGSRSFADLGATINKTRYTVYEQVDFSVTNNYRLCNVTNVYNATNKFTAPNQVLYVNKQSNKVQ
jgi:hypothetical protein